MLVSSVRLKNYNSGGENARQIMPALHRLAFRRLESTFGMLNAGLQDRTLFSINQRPEPVAKV